MGVRGGRAAATRTQVGTLAANGSYPGFRAALALAEVQVEVAYDDSLGECLVDHGCLTDLLTFLQCMTGVCVQHRGEEEGCAGLEEEELATCLARGVRRSSMRVEYRREGREVTFGWDEGGALLPLLASHRTRHIKTILTTALLPRFCGGWGDCAFERLPEVGMATMHCGAPQY